MKLHGKYTLANGSTLALLQFSPNRAHTMGLRLVKLRPGLDPILIRRIDQRGGGIELLREWITPWSSNPGPRSGWSKALSEGFDTLGEMAANEAIF